jgi:hypothetical protein
LLRQAIAMVTCGVTAPFHRRAIIALPGGMIAQDVVQALANRVDLALAGSFRTRLPDGAANATCNVDVARGLAATGLRPDGFPGQSSMS